MSVKLNSIGHVPFDTSEGFPAMHFPAAHDDASAPTSTGSFNEAVLMTPVQDRNPREASLAASVAKLGKLTDGHALYPGAAQLVPFAPNGKVVENTTAF